MKVGFTPPRIFGGGNRGRGRTCGVGRRTGLRVRASSVPRRCRTALWSSPRHASTGCSSTGNRAARGGTAFLSNPARESEYIDGSAHSPPDPELSSPPSPNEELAAFGLGQHSSATGDDEGGCANMQWVYASERHLTLQPRGGSPPIACESTGCPRAAPSAACAVWCARRCVRLGASSHLAAPSTVRRA